MSTLLNYVLPFLYLVCACKRRLVAAQAMLEEELYTIPTATLVADIQEGVLSEGVGVQYVGAGKVKSVTRDYLHEVVRLGSATGML